MTLAIVGLVLLSGVAAADTHGELDVGPGMVGADSPVYGIEVATDKVAMDLGLAQAGGITQERAAEAAAASENNNTDAAVRAAHEAGKAAQRSSSEQDTEGVDKAMASLNNTMTAMQRRADTAPNEQARQGMQTAVDNMAGAMDNMEQAQERRQTGQDHGTQPSAQRDDQEA